MFKKWILTLFSVLLFLPLNGADDFVCVMLSRSGSDLITKCLRKISQKSPIQMHSVDEVMACKDQKDSFLWAHFHHKDVVAEMLAQPKKKWVFNVRDVRDLLWKRVKTGHSNPFIEKKDLHAQWLNLPAQGRITALLSPWEWGENHFLSRCFAVRSSYPFLSQPNVYVTHFEKLVGPKGGGTEEAQVKEILNIARFLDVKLSEERAVQIARSLVRNGEQIGEWKENLDDGNKMLFKLMLGDALIQLGYEKDYNW